MSAIPDAERLGSLAGRTPPAAGAPRAAAVRVGNVEPVWLTLLLRVDLLFVLLTLYASLRVYGQPATVAYAALGVLALILAGRFVTPPDLTRALALGVRPPVLTARLLVEWATVAALLLLVGFALKVSDYYSRLVVLTWFVATPVALVAARALQIQAARWLGTRADLAPRYVIVGANRVGLELSRRLPAATFLGFFEFAARTRAVARVGGPPLAGTCEELREFVTRHGVSTVYLALPMANTPRVASLLAALRDTTANVYFVPDVLGFDLIQARIVDLNGLPGLAICDTPLSGAGGLAKRLVDVALSAAALVALAPLLAAIAIAVRLGSPGPVIFRQRRYGLNGEQIVVYKFRTMTVCEDGATVRQAARADARVTRVGALLRRTSLDELPQLWNVLRGTMSLVGPRPHAVAHNEQYRRLISGYMVRHKMRPGITGWAQVHGLRGETDTVEKMERRVRYDLEYLDNWSLALDFRILLMTVRVLLSGRNAY